MVYRFAYSSRETWANSILCHFMKSAVSGCDGEESLCGTKHKPTRTPQNIFCQTTPTSTVLQVYSEKLQQVNRRLFIKQMLHWTSFCTSCAFWKIATGYSTSFLKQMLHWTSFCTNYHMVTRNYWSVLEHFLNPSKWQNFTDDRSHNLMEFNCISYFITSDNFFL